MMTVIFGACDSEEDLGLEKPEISKEYIHVTPNIQLLADGQVAELTIESNCSWTITKTEEWLTVMPMSGSNTQVVTVSAGKNSTGAERTSVITITAGSALRRFVMVTQPKSGTNDSNTQREPNPDDNQPPT